MKRLSIIFFLIILGELSTAQELTINQIYYQSTTIDINQKVSSFVNGIVLSANGKINDKDGLIRMVLISKTGEKILLYEAYYPLVLPNSIRKIQNCEESDFLKNFEADKIDIQVEDAELTLNSIYLFKNKEDNKNNEYVDAKTYRAQKISMLNTNLMSEDFLWYADETEYSKLPYEKRIAIFGENTNTHGAEYYAGGIFSAVTKKPESSSSKNSIHYVPEFDWRTRHGADKSTSPYFDGNPDFHGDEREYGNGWMTSIKNQLAGNNYTNGCYIFAPLAAVEGLVNLYYNRHIDVDLSEQHVLSCDGYTAAPNYGGFVDNTMLFVKNNGVVTEECFPWYAYEAPCDTSAQCTNPTYQISVSNIFKKIVQFSSEEEIKKIVLHNGPSSASVLYQKYNASGEPTNWGGHAMCLVGYEIIKAGDTLWQRGIQGVPENYTVPEGHKLIGATAWIFKNSTNINDGRQGYRYYVIDGTYNYIYKINSAFIPKNIIGNNYEVFCRDEDNDGFYNWGIGTKPSYCPPCPDLPDGDDSNPNIGPLDDAGFYSYSLPYNFSFEQDDGTWWQSSDDDINWTRHSGSTPSSGTGPSNAQQGSYYMYVEGSSPNFPYKKAVLISPSFDLSTLCNINFSFYYNMYGSNIGSLAVQVSTDGGNTWSNNIWSKSGNQGIGWKNATVNLSSYAGNLVKIKFIAVTGSGINNILPRSLIIGDSDDIAIDNISLNSSLSSSPLIVSNNQTWSSYTSLCQNLTVQSGATLTITGAVIMPKQAVITVKTGSKLIVTGGKITNANIIVESGGELKLGNNGICVLNDNDNLTIDNGAEFNFVSGEIK